MRLLMVVPYFPPDRGPIPLMYGGLATDLAQTYDEVLVITGQPSYAADIKRSWRLYEIESTGGKKIVRVFVPRLNRESLCSRLAFILSYNLLGAAYVLFAADNDVALITNPAVEIWLIALAVCLKKIPYHYRVHDLYPEIAIRLGFLTRKSVLARIVDWMERFCLKSAATVSVITDAFKSRLLADGISPTVPLVIPDWADTTLFREGSKRNELSQRLRLADKFVVGYGGNVGRSQGLDVLVEAADLLRDEKEIVFLIVGEGAKKRELISLSKKKGLDNVFFLPYQPEETLSDVYAAWDVGFVSLVTGLSPEWQTGKILSIMASGRPVLAAADVGGEVHKLIEGTNCGVCVQGGDAKRLAQAIRDLHAHRDRLPAFGISGRLAVEKTYSRQVCAQQLSAHLNGLIVHHNS